MIVVALDFVDEADFTTLDSLITLPTVRQIGMLQRSMRPVHTRLLVIGRHVKLALHSSLLGQSERVIYAIERVAEGSVHVPNLLHTVRPGIPGSRVEPKGFRVRGDIGNRIHGVGRGGGPIPGALRVRSQ